MTACGTRDTALARFLREARYERGMSQEDVARRVGVNKEAVYRWENGLRRPRLRQLYALSDVFWISRRRIVDIASEGDSP